MEAILKNKPNLKSYLKKQINIYHTLVIEDKKAGNIYEEVNGRVHNIFISLLLVILFILQIYLAVTLIHSIDSVIVKIICLAAPIVISFICFYLMRWIAYKLSKFKIRVEEKYN